MKLLAIDIYMNAYDLLVNSTYLFSEAHKTCHKIARATFQFTIHYYRIKWKFYAVLFATNFCNTEPVACECLTVLFEFKDIQVHYC